MRKLLFLLSFLIPTSLFAQRFGSIRTGDDVSLSSNTILNQNSLQSGATFYVSSGTIAGQFEINGGSTTGFGSIPSYGERLLFNMRNNTFFPASKMEARMQGNAGFQVIGANLDGSEYAFWSVIPGATGLTNSEVRMGDVNNFTGKVSLFLGPTGELRISTRTVLREGVPLRFTSVSDTTKYVEFVASQTLAGANTYVWMPSSGPAGRSIITDGNNNFSFGLSSAASNTSANNFPMGDANGSLQPSILSYLPSYPIFDGGIVFSAGNILATGDMGGLSASLVNGSLNAKMSFGVGSGFTSTYRTNVPDDPPGPYQTWVSTGPSGREFQFQNTTVIVSTSGLQTGATFYVSSGTVTNVQVSTVNFNDGSTLATSPEKEYWWPAGATFPLEADADSIASVVLSSATKFDFLTTDFDSATDECRSLNFFVSSNTLVSVTTVTLNAYWGSYTATSGNVGWYFYHNNGAQHGEKPDTLTPQSHSSSFDSVNGSTGTYTVTSWDVSVSSLTWRGGDIVDAKLCRDADNGSDTMSGDAKLYGFGMRFKRK